MIYAIADLHLDYTEEKSMEVFGPGWKDYQNKIFTNWQQIVKESDTVLVPGDISWAMDLKNAYVDLKKIDDLKGKKILMKGNHDFWWSSLNKLNKCNFKSIEFLQNNSFEVEDFEICGSRGWISKDNPKFDDHDEKIFSRELLRLENSLKTSNNNLPKIVILHYPPLDMNGNFNEFFDLCKEHKVKHLIYGHLHGAGHKLIVEGIFEGIEVKCVAGDYINFIPERIV
ncbi:MAG: metallophosphoesterase [Peptoniphilaceae bacterium]|nr:metallophosphoesterase [Peptoniphilaceae bacterium]MDY6018422.1 metallophosphoesterase [Anaerococcus sp.]